MKILDKMIESEFKGVNPFFSKPKTTRGQIGYLLSGYGRTAIPCLFVIGLLAFCGVQSKTDAYRRDKNYVENIIPSRTPFSPNALKINSERANHERYGGIRDRIKER